MFLSSSKSLILQETLCQQFIRKLAIETKKKTVSLKTLFPDVVKTGHSNPDIANMIKVMAKESVPSEFSVLKDLKLTKVLGTVKIVKRLNNSSIFEQVQKSKLTSIGHNSETSKIEKNWKNLLFKAKVTDPKVSLCHLQENLQENREICSLLSLFLMKDFETLRLPSLPLNHVLGHFAYSGNRWTKEEETTLLKNQSKTDDELLKKISSKNLRQIKRKMERMEEIEKAEIKREPFTKILKLNQKIDKLENKIKE